MYRLTAEGERYLKKGLPELQLMALLDKSSLTVKEAQQKIENFAVALQWAKKKGWITLDRNVVVAAQHPRGSELQKALEHVSIDEPVDETLLSVLEQRRLVSKERDDIVKRAERLVGNDVTVLSEELIKTNKWRDVRFREYNVESPGPTIYPGKRQPYAAFLDWVRSRLVALGFAEMTGPLVETEFWNMDALFMPQHHSARDIHDVYFIKEPAYAKNLDEKIVGRVKRAHERGVAGSAGWQYTYDVRRSRRHVLRSQGTALSAKTLSASPVVPGRYFSIMRCFRYDVVDAKHLPDFYQVEGVIIDEGLTLRHLAGVLRMFAREFAQTADIKLTPTYFPFTEPSVELQARHPKLGWIELGGSGMFRKEMTVPLGIDVPVIAWGLGIDRIAMLNLGVNDIRDLFSTDLAYLRKTKVTY